jgi:hypothetical protein
MATSEAPQIDTENFRLPLVPIQVLNHRDTETQRGNLATATHPVQSQRERLSPARSTGQAAIHHRDRRSNPLEIEVPKALQLVHCRKSHLRDFDYSNPANGFFASLIGLQQRIWYNRMRIWLFILTPSISLRASFYPLPSRERRIRITMRSTLLSQAKALIYSEASSTARSAFIYSRRRSFTTEVFVYSEALSTARSAFSKLR